MRGYYVVFLILLVFFVVSKCSGGYESIYEKIYGSTPPYQDELERIIKGE